MTVYQFSTDQQACDFAREQLAQGVPAAVTPTPWPGGSAVVKTGPDANTDRLAAFAAEVKRLCADFSDRQNRPYMGDVTAALDALLAQFEG